MTLTAALIGGTIGTGCHMLNNAARKIPLSRYPWGHVGLFIAGAYIGVKYEQFEKRQVEEINEMRADRGLPQLTGTEAFYEIEAKDNMLKQEATTKEPGEWDIGPHLIKEASGLGQFNKYIHNQMYAAEKMKADNQLGEEMKYDEEEMSDKKLKLTQHFFNRIAEREDYEDDVRAYCKKLSTATKFGEIPEGFTMEDVKAIRRKLVERRMKKYEATITDEKRQAVKEREGKPLFDFTDLSKYPEDIHDELNRTGSHIKIQEYLNAKLDAFKEMPYEEQKEHLRSLFSSLVDWNRFTTEEKLHIAVPNFDDLPYEEQKKLRKSMVNADKYGLPIGKTDPDYVPGNSELFKEMEKAAMENKKNWMFKNEKQI